MDNDMKCHAGDSSSKLKCRFFFAALLLTI